MLVSASERWPRHLLVDLYLIVNSVGRAAEAILLQDWTLVAFHDACRLARLDACRLLQDLVDMACLVLRRAAMETMIADNFLWNSCVR